MGGGRRRQHSQAGGKGLRYSHDWRRRHGGINIIHIAIVATIQLTHVHRPRRMLTIDPAFHVT
jgi:hypothetical protein